MKREEKVLIEPHELDTALQEIIAQTIYSTADFGYTFYPGIFKASYHSLLRQLLTAIDSEHDKVLALAPRGMGKTSWALYGYAARNLVNCLNRFLVYLTNSSTAAIRSTDNLKRSLIGNKELTAVYGSLKPGDLKTDEGALSTFAASSWALANGAFVVPRGAGQQVRGLQIYIDGEVLRPQIIIIDDLENSETVQSEEQRAKLKEWFFGDVLKIEDQYSKPAKIIYIDTLKHEASLAAELMNDPTWHKVRLSVCDDEFNTYAPEFMSTAKIKALYQVHFERGLEDVFYREYMNKPISTKTRAFKPQNFRYFYERPHGQIATVAPETATGLKEKFTAGKITEPEKDACKEHVFTLASNGVLPSPQYTVGSIKTVYNIIIVDPAKTQKIDSAETAIVLFGVMENGMLLVRSVISGKFTPEKIYENIVALCNLVVVYRVAIEVTGLDLFITQPLKSYLKTTGFHNLANTLIELRAGAKAKKLERIAWLVPYYERHLIYHNLACYSGLEGQLLSFPASEKLDIMDCSAWIVHILGTLELSISENGRTLTQIPSEAEHAIDWSLYQGGYNAL